MDEIRRLLVDLNTRLENLEKGIVIKILTIPSDDTGALVIKAVSADPSTPKNNEVWINTTTNLLKWNKAGTIKTVALT